MARNAFTMIFVGDPTSTTAAELALMALHQKEQGYPIRYGVALVMPSLIARMEAQRKYPYQKHEAPEFADMVGA
jgi:hypothetical protein